MVCYLRIDSFNVCVFFVNPLTTVTNPQENQEKFHGFSTFTFLFFLNFCCITTQQDMVWDTGVPMVVKGTFYTMYIPYPQTQLAQLGSTVNASLLEQFQQSKSL